MLGIVLLYGCSTMEPIVQPGPESDGGEARAAAHSPVEPYIALMKRAASVDGQNRQSMLTEIDRRAAESPLEARLKKGFLLTSPSESEAGTREGEKILREVLAGHSDLHPLLRDLVEVRLHEVEVRQALRVELSESKGTIRELLSIESSMEKKKTESQSRSR